MWRGDGREIYFVSGDQQIMASTIEPSAGALRIGIPKPLFSAKNLRIGSATLPYDVSRDGQRFLVQEPVQAPRGNPITVILNWQGLLDKSK